MAQTYNKMKIDIKEPVTDIITAKQNDSNSRFLDVYLYDGGVPINLTGHELRIYMLKADGTEVFNNGEITNATAGRCQFELTDQALGAYGKLQCEITLWKNNVQILTTPTFDIFVVKSLRTNGSIESSNEYGALVVLYQNLYEAFDLITTMVEQFGEPGEVADAASIETFWQMLEYLYGANEAALKNASVQGVIDLIGATGNTGGSATAGTLMAKENAIIGYLLNTTYGLEAIRNSIKSQIYMPGTTVLKNIPFTTVKCSVTGNAENWRRSIMKVSDNFIPVADGIVNISGSVSFSVTNGSNGGTKFGQASLIIASLGKNPRNADNAPTTYDGQYSFSDDINLAKGSYIIQNNNTSAPYRFDDATTYAGSFRDTIGYYILDLQQATTFDIKIPVNAGYPVMTYLILEVLPTSSANSTNYAAGGTAVLTSLQVKGLLNTI